MAEHDYSKPIYWYDRTWVVILLLIVFFPVGLYALYKGNAFGPTGKILLTLVVLIVVVNVAADPEDFEAPPTTSQQASTTQQTEQAAEPEPEPAPEPSEPRLELLSHYWQNAGHGTAYVVGRIRNNTSSTLSYVQVQVNLTTQNGEVVGSTLDNMNNLSPGSVWRFKAYVTEDNAARYQITDITGY